MNAREWTALVRPPARWARLAARLDSGLEAVFDDGGRAGLAFAPSRAPAWRAFASLAGLRARRPGFAWAFCDGSGSGARGPVLRPWTGKSGVPELDAALAAFHGLHPLSGLELGSGRLEARLAEPAPWPLFARCDLAKAFAARGGAWARRLGARGVAGFAFSEGRMEIFVA